MSELVRPKRRDPNQLREGQRFRMGGAEWVVELVTECSATVKCLGGRRTGTRSVEFANGGSAEFDVYAPGQQPGRRTTICPQAFVEKL